MTNAPTDLPTETTSGGMNRRSFIGRGLAFTGATMFSSMATMQQFAAAAAAQQGDDSYKALVCLFLFGGNDGYNTLIPTHPGELADYQDARKILALKATPVANLGPFLPLALSPTSPNTTRSDGGQRGYALHPAMPEMQSLFDTGALSFVANVGNLSQPTTVQQYQAAVNGNPAVAIPKALFSHSDQQTQWRNAEPNMAVPDGWAGRFPDELSDQNLGSIPMRISLNGNTNWLANQGEGSYVIGASGSRSLSGDDSNDPNSVERVRFEAQVGGDLVNVPDNVTFDATPQTNVFKQLYNNEVRRTVDLHGEFSAQFVPALAQLEAGLSDQMVDNTLEAKLKAIAATISASQGLQMKRQVFFVGIGGFDTHDNQIIRHNDLMGLVSRAMGKFWDALGVIGAQQDVVTFSASEFGRTLRRNRSGTDHAWASNQWVMGGPVDGAKIFGSYPEELTLGGPLDVELNGRLLPTTSIDEYGGELARWFGVPAGDIPAVFPNADLFYNPAVTPNPVGFMAQPQPPQEDQVDVVQSCFGTPSSGRFDVSVTNNSAERTIYAVALSGLSPRVIELDPAETKTVTYTARRDGLYTVTVRRSTEANPFFTETDIEVDCFVPVPWVVTSSCLGGSGRLDLWIENETSSDALFRISYTQGVREITRVRSIPAGEIQRSTVTGRQYGTWFVGVENLSTGEKIFSETVDVLCGAPTMEAVIRNSCMRSSPAGFRGRIDVDLWNDSTTQTRSYEVIVSRTLAPFIGEQVRSATLAPGQRTTLTVTGRPNMSHEVSASDVTGGAERKLATETVDFTC